MFAGECLLHGFQGDILLADLTVAGAIVTGRLVVVHLGGGERHEDRGWLQIIMMPRPGLI